MALICFSKCSLAWRSLSSCRLSSTTSLFTTECPSVVTVITDNGSGDMLPKPSSPLSLTCIGRLTTTPKQQKKIEWQRNWIKIFINKEMKIARMENQLLSAVRSKRSQIAFFFFFKSIYKNFFLSFKSFTSKSLYQINNCICKKNLMRNKNVRARAI